VPAIGCHNPLEDENEKHREHRASPSGLPHFAL